MIEYPVMLAAELMRNMCMGDYWDAWDGRPTSVDWRGTIGFVWCDDHELKIHFYSGELRELGIR